MVFSSCFCHSPSPPKIVVPRCKLERGQSFSFPIRNGGPDVCYQDIVRARVNLGRDWSFLGGSRIIPKPKAASFVLSRKLSGIHAWLPGSQLASSCFTLGTAAVLPFYILMVLAPNSELTRKVIESSIPYVVLGILYTYLLYLSWTPDTIQLIFASKYWLPELPGIAKMFSSEMTLASAWIHLLVVDLFAARQVFLDGLENEIKTRHSVSFCLLFCPIGILSHVITKALTQGTRSTKHSL